MKGVKQDMFVATHGRGNCMSAAIASIMELPLHEVVDTASDECRANWDGTISDWLAQHGKKLVYYFDWHDNEKVPDGFSIACGPSPRGQYYHAVVVLDGKPAFDPHPDDTYLLSTAYYCAIEDL